MYRPYVTWAEISRSALTHNITTLRSVIGPDTLLGTVVKANAYGHGIVDVAKIFVNAGADWLIVHSIIEARLLREAGVSAPILVIGYVTIAQLPELVDLDCRIMIYDRARAEILQTIAREKNHIAKLHIKLETGINRQGLQPDETVALAKYIATQDNLELEGLYSHFADIEDTTDRSYSKRQLRIFDETYELLQQAGITVPIRHIANAAATMLFPETRYEMVRPGIACYGLWPSEVTKELAEQRGIDIKLREAFSWKAVIAQVKPVAKGEKIGYGCTYTTERDMMMAVIPVGYFEGFDRKLAETGYVLIHGKPCKLVGRVCMNNIMVDITDVDNVQPEDEVVFIGIQGDEQITGDMYANWASRINYEIPTRISTQISGIVPRIIVD